ncbi:hypothetical protein CHLNCDRAFT_142780 [Chlorella variabilis]|uniref:Uncharacterized protein n=1 Tax=Chlorella variabilis TaxID=554065 RepID=E1Z8R0_CHLVA|nr:hypothetical protein CHLNCDRAFT_142780 [Chlorella variabilis]EFN57382.1 hypothetical protein CHLNCDRAFT_142780 [Chlorella variabilis]|eukprot:XP_005849484.1 hypothetical protein CHLNCDRAFT_142780 [Chlorella variabilis]
MATHVTAEPVGVAFLPQPEQQLFFDEAAACIHLVEGRMITAVALPSPMYGGGAAVAAAAAASLSRLSLSSSSPDPSGYDSDSSVASTTARAFLVSEGPPVRHIRSSLDGAFTALHRSARLVEVHCHATGNMFIETAGADKQGRKGCDPRLLGFFWTAAQFVMVTAGGLEIHLVHPSLQGLRMDATVPLQGVQWYTYSPETHMVVLGFGSSGAKLQAIQFSKAGTLKLPLLDLTPPWGSPIRPVQAAAVSAALEGFSAARGQPERLVAPDTCWVVVLYGRVFCAHHDRGAGLLRLYRMFRCGSAADAGPLLPRDATSLAHQYEVYARQLELSVVDNVLLVHHIDSAVVMLVDIMEAGPAPVSSPLPLAVPLARGGADPEPGAGEAAAAGAGADAGRSGEDGQEAAAEQDAAAGEAPELPVSTGGGGEVPAGASGAAAAPALQLHYPAWLVDGGAGLVYRLQLDLRAVADSQSDYLRLLAFLQRRRPSGVPRRDPAGITLRVLRGLMQDEAQLPLLRSAFDVVNAYGGEGARAQQGGRGDGRAPHRQPCLTLRPPYAQDVYSSAFAVLRARQAASPAYLRAALAEFVASCHAHGAPPAPSLASLYVDLLLDQGHAYLVAPLLLSHPQLDSELLAEHVEAAAAGGRLPQGAQLAEQLLVRLGAHAARCRLLLRLGRVRQALVLAKRQRLVRQLAPEVLLEAAAATGDAVLLAAAQRLFRLNRA